jgi:hypothetical protein
MCWALVGRKEGRKGFRARPGEATASDEIIKRRAGGGGSQDNKAFTWCSQWYAGGIPGIGGQPCQLDSMEASQTGENWKLERAGRRPTSWPCSLDGPRGEVLAKGNLDRPCR